MAVAPEIGAVIAIGDEKYELGGAFYPQCPEEISELEGKPLVVARQLDPSGDYFARMQKPVPYSNKIERERDESPEAYSNRYLAHLHESANQKGEIISVPALAGRIAVFNPGYFTLRRQAAPEAVIPYARPNMPARYLIQLATLL